MVRALARDELRAFLADRQIGTEVYYPLPLHLQECFAYLGYKPGDLPESERAAKEVLALAYFPRVARRRAAARGGGDRGVLQQVMLWSCPCNLLGLQPSQCVADRPALGMFAREVTNRSVASAGIRGTPGSRRSTWLPSSAFPTETAAIWTTPVGMWHTPARTLQCGDSVIATELAILRPRTSGRTVIELPLHDDAGQVPRNVTRPRQEMIVAMNGGVEFW